MTFMSFMLFMCAFGIHGLGCAVWRATLADSGTNPRYLPAIATVSVTVA